MILRTISAMLGLPILMAAILGGQPWLSLLMAVVAGIAVLEVCGLARRCGRRPSVVVAVIWAVGLVAVGHIVSLDLSLKDTYVAVLAVASASGLALLIDLVWHLRNPVSLGDWVVTLIAATLTGGLLAYAPLLMELDRGQHLVIFVFFVTFTADTFAFLVGTTIGVRLLAPRISPGKTWEGAIGGLIGATIAALVLTQILNLGIAMMVTLPLGLAMGVVAQFGDLAESWLKRKAMVKDSGWILPGHGGVLDRIDSIVFNLALMYYFAGWIIL